MILRRWLRVEVLLVAVLLAVVLFLRLRDADDRTEAPSRSIPTPSPSQLPATAPAPVSKLRQLAAEIPTEAISPIAADLNAPAGTIQRDLEIMHAMFEAWQTNFPGSGNPVGENAEITVALAGDNRLRFAFVSPTHAAISAGGELCDRWGTPFRFHQLDSTLMEIRSAGPDRKFATEDDVQLAPPRNTP